MHAGAGRVPGVRQARSTAKGTLGWLARHGFAVLITLSLLLVALPWVAPFFMRLDLVAPARAIYLAYSFLCHQLPQRSYFLFGERLTYSLAEIQAAWQPTNDPWVLRQFIGTPAMGYKVAWSDRMVSLYTSIPLAALLWWPMRKRIRPLPLGIFALLALPILVDGTSHMVSDLAGIGQGFRDGNEWLVTLTGNRLPTWFYAGDAWGSFNSLMRLVSGALFGIALVWMAFPRFRVDLGLVEQPLPRVSSPAAPSPITRPPNESPP